MPIPILQYGVKVRDPTTQQFSDLAALRGGQGPTGPGVPAGGTDGDVLIKNGATDYDGRWTNTPPQMGSLARINATNAAETTYYKGEYLVYNGQLYRVTAVTISQGVTLNPGSNISAVSVADDLELTGYPFPTSSLSSKLTYHSGSIYKKAGIVELYLRATSNADIAAWEALLTGLPSEYRPFDTNNAFYMIVDNNIVPANFNGNGILNTPVAITNNKGIRFRAIYIANN